MITWWHQTFNKLFAVDRGLAVIGCGSVWPELSSENFVKKYINYNVLLGTNDYGNYKQDYMVLGRQHIVFSDLEVTSSGHSTLSPLQWAMYLISILRCLPRLQCSAAGERGLKRGSHTYVYHPPPSPPALPAPPTKKINNYSWIAYLLIWQRNVFFLFEWNTST